MVYILGGLEAFRDEFHVLKHDVVDGLGIVYNEHASLSTVAASARTVERTSVPYTYVKEGLGKEDRTIGLRVLGPLLPTLTLRIQRKVA